MGYILYMNITDFVTDFIKDKKASDYEFMIISKDIIGSIKRRNGMGGETYESKYDNVDFLPSLFPYPSVMEYAYSASKETFMEAYQNQLIDKENMIDLCSVIDMVINDDMKVIFLSSVIEYETRFFDALRNFIRDQFKFEIKSYEEYKNGDDLKIENIEEVKETLKFQIASLYDDVDEFFNKFTDNMADKFKELLMKKDINELVQYGNSKGIHVNKRKPKEEIVERIYNKIIEKR